MIEWQRAQQRVGTALETRYIHGSPIKPLVLLVLPMPAYAVAGEALGLTWGAIDVAHGQIHVEAATSKSGQSRDLPMTTEGLQVLEALRDQQTPEGAKNPDPAAHLFTLPDGTRLQSVGAKTWNALMIRRESGGLAIP